MAEMPPKAFLGDMLTKMLSEGSVMARAQIQSADR
jgi:hypothetical protein